jgi:hypothetical protein
MLQKFAKTGQDKFASLFSLFVSERAKSIQEYPSGPFVGLGGFGKCALKFGLGHLYPGLCQKSVTRVTQVLLKLGETSAASFTPFRRYKRRPQAPTLCSRTSDCGKTTSLAGILCSGSLTTAATKLAKIGISGDDAVLVVDLGPMGLAALMLAKSMGARAVLSLGSGSKDRLLTLLERYGAVAYASFPPPACRLFFKVGKRGF